MKAYLTAAATCLFQRRRVLSIILGLLTTASQAEAEWFPRLDDNGKLVVSGVAVDPDGVTNGLFLTCEDDTLTFTVLTFFTSSADDLKTYSGTKVTFASRTKEGDPVKIGTDGTPVLLPANILAIQTKLSAEQSSLVYHFIGRGQRIDIELVHPDLASDRGVKKVFALGTNTALLAIHEACPGIK
ncbi:MULTISPECIES: hypothetical protein [Rhizobium]|uniref:hypothetical protein n=1 Tax=Rhizobium TaxID=379 RepID=UPI0010303E79|nr:MULTISPECIES: hypothetical protein [Rhizobium]MBA1343962.1 hypothetical protein [Rhizobium sp. WYCCWR 11146]TBF89107.1 hypothetical protein ELG82_36795 [Rhizobium leguminosarum]